MKWVNHIIIGGSIALAINPLMIPVAIAGSTAPDWFEGIIQKVFKYPIGHREQTHYLVFWLASCLFAFFVADFHGILFWFSIGGLSHVLADSLTVSGVPLGWWSQKRFHIFGGRIKTGESGEYFVSGSVALVAVGIGYGSGSFSGSSFFPFFYHWSDLYQQGLIDGYEWKKNRFNVI